MCKIWTANAHYKSLAECPLEDLYSRGYRLALLDIDNTLAVHGSKESQDYARAQLERFKKIGFSTYILSNAKRERAEQFGHSLDPEIHVIGDARKPGIKGIKEAMQLSGISEEKCILFGDQLFTDVWSGTRAGVQVVLVDRISSKEPWYIHLKRGLEWIVHKLANTRKYYDKIPFVQNKTDA